MSLSQESNDLKKAGVQRVFKLLYDYFFVKLKNKHDKKTDCMSVLIKRLKKVKNYATLYVKLKAGFERRHRLNLRSARIGKTYLRIAVSHSFGEILSRNRLRQTLTATEILILYLYFLPFLRIDIEAIICVKL
jgi:hypothetical protein